MEYQKTNVNAFLGLDNNQRPELIKDQEASDIENLRFDKLGYLINRNGVQNVGISMSRTIDADVDYPGVLWGIGAMGITEYVIESPWGDKNLPAPQSDAVSPYDDNTLTHFTGIAAGTQKYTDRFMVYAVRIPAHKHIAFAKTDANNESNKNASGVETHMANQYTWRYKAAYILVPLTGPQGFRDTFAFAPNGNSLDGANNYQPVDSTLPTLLATMGSRSIVRADDKPKKLQIYAPSRWLGVHNEFADAGIPKDLNWIEHYVSMQQYRESVVISDMTNADMYLVDEYMEAEYQDIKKHRFTLRENALAHFDIDDVVVDFGIGGFNEGVESEIALYKFYLDRSRFQATQDNHTPYFSANTESPVLRKYQANLVNWLPEETSTFITTEFWTGSFDDTNVWACGISINGTTRYIFSNQSESSEYDDLLAPLTLQNPDIKEDDQVSADVYRWKDLKIKYYTVTGKTAEYAFLTGLDRQWNKSSSGATKLIKLKTKTGVEQNVPLGVWRYRFVWYMGNGEYSAPSAELVVPDLLFSGLQDADIIDSLGSYRRPIGIMNFSESEQQNWLNWAFGDTPFMNITARMQAPKLFSYSLLQGLTAYGRNFLAVKKSLYDPVHVFAAKYSSTSGATWPTFVSGENALAKNNLGVVCTMFWPSSAATLSGVAVQAAASVVENKDDGGVKEYPYPANGTVTYNANDLPINVPLFRDSGGGSYSYNSVFTDYGNLRTAYQNTLRNNGATLYDAAFPSYQIVFGGAQRYGADKPSDNNYANGYVGSEVVKSKESVWFNLVPFKGGKPVKGQDAFGGNDVFYELNNIVDSYVVAPTATPFLNQDTALTARNMTQLRGVNKESDRLAYIKPGIPAEVLSRILLSGSGELTLCDYGDVGTWVTQKELFPMYDADNLEHTDQRVFTVANANPIFNLNTDLFAGYVNAYTKFIKAPFVGNTIRFSNLRVLLTGVGERLTIPEQLSMYIPASLLFEAPHVELVVPANRIPRRARQMLIFRTRASHDNAWQPHEYGLVKAVDIKRNSSGAITSAEYADGRLRFLDDVKSSELDYSYALNDYDGFTSPIKSRFCLPLNERVFYANIKESYRPHKPRTALDVANTTSGDVTPDATVTPHRNLNFGLKSEMSRLWSHKLYEDTGVALSKITKRWLYYFVAYSDQARSFSLASCSGEIDRGDWVSPPPTGDPDNAFNKPVLFCMPSAYDAAVEQGNIYRLQLDAPIQKIVLTSNRFSNQIAAGLTYYVLQGVVEYNGVVYYPNDVIRTFDGNDVGYDVNTVNRFINYFITTNPTASDRGNAGSYCQPVLYNITNYFAGAGGPDYIEKVATIKPEDEGIFYDNDLPSLGRLPLKQIFQNEDVMPAGLRWSEPYQSNKIKLASLMEVRSGDGDQITGLAMLYGNLIVLKERSIHRLAVQGAAVPVSRVDEISNNVGCIAPNTVITVNNTLYFLSWAGFYRYDNNVLSKVDGAFAEELQLRLRSSQNGVINPAIRDASCGWNSAYRELYLTIPIMSTSTNEGDAAGQYNGGVTLVDNKNTRIVRGVTYAINVDNGLVTKYRYMDDSIYFTDPQIWQEQVFPYSPRQRAPRVYSRLYYTNSLGQLRSAEVLPPRTFNYLDPALPASVNLAKNNASMEFMRASFFIESPTKDLNNRDKPKDDYLTFMQDQITNQYGIFSTSKFVRIFWASKSWTAEDKSVLKRIRKVFAYIGASDDPTIVRGIVHTSPEGETATTDIAWQYTFADTRITSIRLGYSVTGELLSIPTEASGSSSAPSQNRGERHMFEIEGSGAFQMEYFAFHWKPINQYER